MSLAVFEDEKGVCEFLDRDNFSLNDEEKMCEHPLFVCLAYGNLNSYTYKCVCVRCGKAHYFKEYELKQLWMEHRIINENLNMDLNNLYNFKDIQDYYNESLEHLVQLKKKIQNDDIPAELVAAEKTFQHFTYLKKGKRLSKRMVI